MSLDASSTADYIGSNPQQCRLGRQWSTSVLMSATGLAGVS